MANPLPGRTPNRRCVRNDCTTPAEWTVTTSGHPTGDVHQSFCHHHLFTPAWADAPTPYTITITGPHRREGQA